MRYIDLDGTLLDLWPRYYKVFCTLLHVEDIKFEEYRKRKRQYGKDGMVARFFGYELPKGYFSKKKELLEEREYLALDCLLLTVEEIKKIFRDDKTMLLTKRRFPKQLEWQLDQLGLDIPMVTANNTKLQWLRENCFEESIIVGDSLIDLDAGKLDNISPIMVGYGLGTKVQFDNYGVKYTYMDTPQKMLAFLCS